ncbi:MAG: sialate O-acetylesterase [Chthoniobacterales bacterium]
MIRALFLCLLSIGTSLAAIDMPSFFSDGMVLQRELNAPVWGWADAGTEITVDFNGQKLTTKADENGKWRVVLQGLKASDKGTTLTVTSGNEKKEIQNVLVGEVWLASGQSNMEWPVARTNDGDAAKQRNDQALRVYLTRNVVSAEPLRDFPGVWTSSEPGKTEKFTAVGYQFARRLREELQVPVGIIECAWGGKPIQAFMSPEALQKLPVGQSFLEKRKQAFAEFDPDKLKEERAKLTAEHEKKMAEWEADKEGKKKPMRLRLPVAPQENSALATNIFNGMISPLAGYGARGAIWYQGEANANRWVATHYAELQAGMIADWRTRWGSDLSFYYVQLANYRKPSDKPGVHDDWAQVQDEQRQMLGMIDKVGMAVINDIGEEGDIHPLNKKDVGARLARWALNRDYGKTDIVVSGPLYSGVTFSDGKAVVSFDFAEGLKTRDGKPLQRVEIAGEDGVWHWADSKIEDNKLVAWSEDVKTPKKVRYAWSSNPVGATLINAEGLPASCFTSEANQ